MGNTPHRRGDVVRKLGSVNHANQSAAAYFVDYRIPRLFHAFGQSYFHVLFIEISLLRDLFYRDQFARALFLVLHPDPIRLSWILKSAQVPLRDVVLPHERLLFLSGDGRSVAGSRKYTRLYPFGASRDRSGTSGN